MENRGPGEVRATWAAGGPYERYVGRWSRIVAPEFLAWLALPRGQVWGDVGCGTGALAASVLAAAEPRAVLAIDRSAGFLAAARGALPEGRVQLAVADAAALPWASGACDAAVSGLVLNFVPDAVAMLREMARATRPGGRVATYVWDYHGGMEMMSHFWGAAVETDAAVAALDESLRFPLCRPEALAAAFEAAGLADVSVRPITIPTLFRDFDDYWTPFLGGQGPAPTYLASLSDDGRERIRALLRERLTPAADGSIALSARAWAAQGAI